MRIGIDARFLTHPQLGGFKTYTENLIHALSQIDTANSYVLYVDRLPDRAALPNKHNFTYRVVEGKLPVVGMPLREQFGLPKYIARDRIDVMHFPCLTAALGCQCPFIVSLHDTIWLDSRPGSLSSQEGRSLKRWAMWLYNRWVPKWAAQRARHIIAVSQAAKADIVAKLGTSPEKISVIHNTFKDIFQPNQRGAMLETTRQRYDLAKDFILGIGSADPRKNIVGLVSAYARLPTQQRSQYQLCIVWTHRFLAREMLDLTEQLGIRDRVRFLEQVSDEDLAALYKAATLFVFPSHYEGFGLPALEAMACGTPVVAANNSSIPEVVNDAGMLVDCTDFGVLARAVEYALDNADLRDELGRKGLERAKLFSWEQFGKRTLEVYERVLD